MPHQADWTERAREAAKANHEIQRPSVADVEIIDAVLSVRDEAPEAETPTECIAFAYGYFKGKGWL